MKAKTEDPVMGKFLTSVPEFQGERRKAGDDLTASMLDKMTPNAREALIGEGIIEIFGRAPNAPAGGASDESIAELNAKIDFLTDLVETLSEKVAKALPKAVAKPAAKKTKPRAEARAH